MSNDDARRPTCEGDDPEMDGTDFAHPAWWRGHEQTSHLLCERLTDVLDGKDDGAGGMHEPVETLRRRIMALIAERDALRTAVEVYRREIDLAKAERNALRAACDYVVQRRGNLSVEGASKFMEMVDEICGVD